MFLIDSTEEYFNREYHIPNLTENYSESAEYVKLLVNSKISKLLKNDVLGIELYNDFYNNLDNGILKPDADQKWLDLVNGCQYELNDKFYYWKGLVYEENGVKESLFVPYIFNIWFHDTLTQSTMAGEQSIKVTNSVNVLNNKRIVESWNDFLNQYQGNIDNIYINKFYHRGILFEDYCYDNHRNVQVSLIKFLNDNKEFYPNAILKRFRHENSFNI